MGRNKRCTCSFAIHLQEWWWSVKGSRNVQNYPVCVCVCVHVRKYACVCMNVSLHVWIFVHACVCMGASMRFSVCMWEASRPPVILQSLWLTSSLTQCASAQTLEQKRVCQAVSLLVKVSFDSRAPHGCWQCKHSGVPSADITCNNQHVLLWLTNLNIDLKPINLFG